MNLRIKLVGIIAVVALVPLIVSTLTTLRLHQSALESALGALHGKVAEDGATRLASYLTTTESTLTRAAESIDWPALDAREREGALWLLYRQLPDSAVVAMLDEKGEGIGEAVYRALENDDADIGDHPPARMSLLGELARNITLGEARASGYHTGTAFAADGYSRPFLPVVLRVRGRGGDWFIAVAVSLAPLCDALTAAAPTGTSLVAIDPRGRAACSRNAAAFATPPRIAAPSGTTVARITAPDGEERLAAAANASEGWWVLVEQPADGAFATSHRIRTQTVGWIAISLLVAVAAGLLLGRSVSRPVATLVHGALELARGNFAFRSPVAGHDEFGRLAATFNHMSEEVERRDREIRAWNADLQRRVDERTQELREAQEQLFVAHKMAAVTSLGAGIAHEINNPLASVLGAVQVVRAKLDKEPGKTNMVELLGAAEQESLRIKEIVRRILAFSQTEGNDTVAPVDLHAVIDACLASEKSALVAASVEVIRDLDVALPSVRGNGDQLCQALREVVRNARQAMPSGGRLSLATSTVEGKAVRLTVTDTGRGISREHLDKIFEPFFTTKENNWRGEGLGLAIAFKIVEAHHGTIKARSSPGEGTTIAITLPAAELKAHLH